MYEYFKNMLERNSCRSIGVCSVHPSVNSVYEVLLGEIREISFYIVKLKEFNLLNRPIMQKMIEALSIFIVNTSFNKVKYLNLLKELALIKKEIKERYIQYCSLYQFPCEMINSGLEINDKTTISDLIETAQNSIINKQKSCNKDKQHMFDLIALFAKLSAINVLKLKKINCAQEKIDKYNYEIIRFFSLTNGYSIRNEKIKRRILEFCSIALEIKQELNSCLEKKYGKKEKTDVSTSIQKGYGILISGDDIDELEEVLYEIEQMDIDEHTKEKINVYTNGALFLAHFYPFFKNNKYLKGHIGTNNIEYDFSTFTGSILLTQNFVQKIDNLYRGEIFSNKIISFERVQDIEYGDYEPLIVSALKVENKVFEQKEKIKSNYDFEKIKKKFENYNHNEAIIIIGQIKEDDSFIKEKEEKIINLTCPLENDLLFDMIEILKNKEVKITILFTQCNLSNLETIMLLLNKKVNTYLASCSSILISPHVIEALKEEFSVNIIE